MTTSVDVIALLHEVELSLMIDGRSEERRQLVDARAAVAELIEAVDKHLFAIRQMDEAMNDGLNVQGAVSAAIGTEDMLRAALSCVKGA